MNHNNQYISKLSDSKINNLINYIFPNYGQSIINDSDHESATYTVFFLSAGSYVTVTLDDFSGIVRTVYYHQRFIHTTDGNMNNVEQMRFYAWMYNEFGARYLRDLGTFLKRQYAGRNPGMNAASR